MDLLISNLWLISYKLSVFIIKWGKQRIVSIQSSASEKKKTPLLGQPASPYTWPPVASLHLPDRVATPRMNSSSLLYCSSVKMKPAGTLAHFCISLRNFKGSRKKNLFVCKVQKHCLIIKGTKYLSLQWDLLVMHQFLEVSAERKRPLSQLPFN